MHPTVPPKPPGNTGGSSTGRSSVNSQDSLPPINPHPSSATASRQGKTHQVASRALASRHSARGPSKPSHKKTSRSPGGTQIRTASQVSQRSIATTRHSHPIEVADGYSSPDSDPEYAGLAPSDLARAREALEESRRKEEEAYIDQLDDQFNFLRKILLGATDRVRISYDRHQLEQTQYRSLNQHCMVLESNSKGYGPASAKIQRT